MSFKEKLCARILSEANDLKRTIPSMAEELNYPQEKLESILKGQRELKDIYQVIDKMSETYPIDRSELLLIEEDCQYAVKVMKAAKSYESRRIFDRQDIYKGLSPYYEYRDTATSRLAPFKPEWIKQLRYVEDANPLNPQVVYNKGHFLHQLTFFVGPVNFYWEVNGQKFCQEMNTGDSNYITPYWKHSFTTRSKDEVALILAITFGGKVRYAQKEFYALNQRAKQFYLNIKKPLIGLSQLIQQQMQNELLSIDNLNQKLEKSKLTVNYFLDEEQPKSYDDICVIAELLHMEPFDLILAEYRLDEEVVIATENESYYYPSNSNPLYKIKPLARTKKMPQLKGFNLTVLSHKAIDPNDFFECPTHTYGYNYSDSNCFLQWEFDNRLFLTCIEPNDSFYIQPFIRHAFYFTGAQPTLFIARAPGNITLSTQRELSQFSDIDRVIQENTCWF